MSQPGTQRVIFRTAQRKSIRKTLLGSEADHAAIIFVVRVPIPRLGAPTSPLGFCRLPWHGFCVIEPKTDPEVEQALERPGYLLSRATTLDEAVSLIASHGFRVVVLNVREWPLDRLRAVAELWESAKGQFRRPEIILVDNDLSDWNVSRFGPVRFSDRRRLPEGAAELEDRARKSLRSRLVG